MMRPYPHRAEYVKLKTKTIEDEKRARNTFGVRVRVMVIHG